MQRDWKGWLVTVLWNAAWIGIPIFIVFALNQRH